VRASAWAATLVVALAACVHAVHSPPSAPRSRESKPKAPAVAAVPQQPTDERGPASSHYLGAIARKSIGPFAAFGSEGGLAAWIVAADGGGPANLFVVPFGTDGAPLRDARVAASVPREATSLLVRPAERPGGGWLLVWSAVLDRGEAVTLLALSPDGAARGVPVDLIRTSDHVTWTDIVQTEGGALCLWAEETAAGDANILAVTVDASGTARGVPARVARGVERWAAVRAGNGVGLALVVRDKLSAGRLSWLQLDPNGSARGAPIAVGKDPTVSGDVDVVPFRDGWLLAWTDRTGEDPQVTLATVDLAGHVRGPMHAMDAVGGSSLVAVATGATSTALAWESPHGHARPSNLLHLASISDTAGLAAQPVTSFEVEARSPTELVATHDGFALLTTPVPACRASHSQSSPAADCVAVPMFVRYDGRLTVVQAEPLFVGVGVGRDHAPASLGWGLLCASDRCIALASTADAPAPVFAINLAPRESPFEAPPVSASPAGAVARVLGIVTLESGEPYIDVAAAQVGEATLLATMTTEVTSAAERSAGRDQTVRVRAFGPEGNALDAGNTVTSRALAVGRVAIASATQPEEGAATAWVAHHDTGAQVHVERLDGHGHRVKEVQLTTAKGDANSVAIAWAGDGWLVAWVDWRDGNGEVYAAKIDRNLNRVSPDQRITRAQGDAADVSLAVSGDGAWIAWSDPRESPREGLGDVYVTLLRTRDAKRAFDETRVLATAAHSRSPEVVVVGDGALVAWIEDSPSGLDSPGAAMVAKLGPGGHVVGAPRALVLGGAGRPTAIVLAPSPGGAQAIVARSGRDSVTLDALEVSADGSGGPAWPVVDLEAPAPFDVALALARGTLLYDDAGGAGGHRRVRRVTIAWNGIPPSPQPSSPALNQGAKQPSVPTAR
jgi:hypothetical protein